MNVIQLIQESLSTTAIWFLAAIGLFTIVGMIWRRHNTAAANLVTVIGILGTFIGIWWSLAGFDSQDIQGSIPQLLEGLKLAFTTSIAGMLASIYLRTLSLTHTEKGMKPEEVSIVTLANLLSEIRDDQKEFFEQQKAHDKSLSETLDQNFSKVITSICGEGESTMLTQIARMRTSFTDKQDELKQVVEDKNDELIREFRQFAETMAKDNTEAFIKALSEAIEEFNNKLAQQFGENFAQLNVAVGNLLEWQREYKSDLEMMMQVYKALVESMVEIRESMATISDKANNLVNASESLQKLLNALDQIRSDVQSHLEAFAKLKNDANDAFPIIRRNIDNLTTGFMEHANGVFAKNQEFVKQQSEAYNGLRDHISDMSQDMTNSVRETMKANQATIDKQSKHYDELDGRIKGIVESSQKMGIELAQSSERLTTELTDVQKRHAQKVQELVLETIDSMNQQAKALSDSLQNSISTQHEKSHEAIRRNADHAEEFIHDSTEKMKSQVKALDDLLAGEVNKALVAFADNLAAISSKFSEDYMPLTQRLREVLTIAEGLNDEKSV